MWHLKKLIFTITTMLMFQASADTIDFSDGAGNNLTTFQKTIQGTGSAAGTIATFSNPIADSGPNQFFNLSNGLALGTGGLGSSWQVSFDRDVSLYQYTIDYSDGNKPFDITGPGVNLIGLSNNAGTVAPPMAPIIFLANQQYSFVLQVTPGTGGLTFLNWDFAPQAMIAPAVIPSLTSFNTGLLTILFLVVLYKKRKAVLHSIKEKIYTSD